MPAERLPGLHIEIVLHKLQQAVEDMPIVLLLPPATEAAGRVFHLFKNEGGMGGLIGGLLLAPEFAKEIQGNLTQPGAESTGFAVVFELGQILDDYMENALSQI